MSQEIFFYQKRLLPTKGKYFMQDKVRPQKTISCHKKLFPLPRNYCFLLEIDYLQGVPENLTHFVLDSLNFKILIISYVKPIILKLTQKGEKW